MTFGLLLALAARPRCDDAGRDAVRKVVDLARQVEAVCQPRYLTDPPTPVRAVLDLPITPASARPRKDGGYTVRYGGLRAIVVGDSISLDLSTSHVSFAALLGGLRRWTRDECIENARAVARLLIPDRFTLGESYVSEPVDPEEPADQDDTDILTDVVLREDPRFLIGRIDLPINPWNGLPTNIDKQRLVWPVVAPDHLLRILPESALTGEAIRVHRSLPSPVPARLGPCRFVYQIPGFRKLPNEMTPAHDASVARREAIPMYEWSLIGRAPEGPWYRRVWVDARTGRGIAVSDLVMPLVGSPAKADPVPSPGAGRWRLGKVSGTFVKADPATFEGVPAVVTNERNEVITLRFDRKTGLVRDETATYRPDAALLGAMRAEKAPVPFGKR